MTDLRAIRVIAGVAGLFVVTTGLSGCVGSPTYGTGTTAGEQLMDDIGDAVTIGSPKGKNIKYAPRPGLVVPPNAETQADLVTPQASLADKNNGQWAESPEEMRARLAQEAEENRNTVGFRSPLGQGGNKHAALSDAQQLQQFRDAKQIDKGNYDNRRFLSDPPTALRQADPAALTDLGEPEATKEKRRKKAATIDGTGSKWWMPFQ